MGGLWTTKVAAKQIQCQCPGLEQEILQYTRGSHATQWAHPAPLDGIVKGQTKYRIGTVDGQNKHNFFILHASLKVRSELGQHGFTPN